MSEKSIFKKIELELPSYIAEWIESFAKEVAMEPRQLVTHIIHYYVEVYNVARRRTKNEIVRKIEELKRKAKSEEAKRLLEELEKEIARM